MLIFHPHGVLFRFVATEDNDFPGCAEFFGENPFRQGFPQRAGSPRNQHTFAVQQHSESPLVLFTPQQTSLDASAGSCPANPTVSIRLSAEKALNRDSDRK